jgi:uncharacterized protein YjbI with pentapeptide repeats
MKTRPILSVALPRIPKDIALPEGGIIDGTTEIVQVRCIDIDLAGRAVAGLTFDRTILQRILMNRTRVSNGRLFDVQCEASDLSGSSWQRPRWQRVHFKGCKLTGAQVTAPAGTDVYFQECSMEGAIFSGGKIKGVHFERCRMARAVFDRVDLGNAIFRGCDLSGVDLTGSRLENVDLRSSDIPDLRVEVGQYKGLTIDPAQAAELVAQFGCVVKYAEED